jgi:hypothetical protein
MTKPMPILSNVGAERVYRALFSDRDPHPNCPLELHALENCPICEMFDEEDKKKGGTP